MSDDTLEAIVKNETEWRKTLWTKVDTIEKSQNKFQKEMLVSVTILKIKYGIISLIFGTLGGGIAVISMFILKKI